MSYHAKLIIPLINKNLTKQDISKDSGFIGMYTDYLKAPRLQKHIFLLYRITNMLNFSNLDKKLKQMDNMYWIQTEHDDNAFYHLYTFTITNEAILRICNTFFELGETDKMRIMKFWNLEDEDVNEFICTPKKATFHKFKPEYISDIKKSGASL